MKPESLRERSRWVLVIAFLAVLCLPFADTWLDLDPAPEVVEFRKPAAWPELNLKVSTFGELPKALENYYDDHFGFRNSLIRLNNRLRLVTGSNLPDTPVIVGKDGWLFVNAGGGLLDLRRAVRPYSEAELEAYASNLVQRKNWLAERGILFLYVLAPDKHSIYPEKLPGNIRRARETDRTDQLTNYLAERTDLEVVDLRKALRSMKSEGLLYPSNGSHWNDLGAFFGAVAIQERVARWFPAASPLLLSEFKVTIQRRRGDIGRMLGLTDVLYSDYAYLQPRSPAIAAKTQDGMAPVPGSFPKGRQFAYTTNDPLLPRAVVFRDSFTSAMVPFLSERFERIAYYWTNFIPTVVEHEKPALVVEIRVERRATRVVDEGR